MPDSYGFDHLPDWGIVYHRCIHCEWPGYGVTVREADRKRHARQHERDRKRELEELRLKNLRDARRLQRQARRENELVAQRQ